MIPASQIPVRPLPVVKHKEIQRGLSVILPLSRRGKGPGLIVLVPNSDNDPQRSVAIRDGVPWPMIKWAEESYTVVEVQQSALDTSATLDVLAQAVRTLEECVECQPKVVGLVGMSSMSFFFFF